MIPVGYFRPDLAETYPGISMTVLNAIINKDAVGVAYGPHPGLEALATSDALASAPRGYLSAVTRSGNYEVYVGTETALYQVAADGSVTEIGTGYAVPSGDDWSMAQFGDYIYFTNTFDGLLRYSIEAGGAVAAVSGAPAARFIFPLFNTLAALDCDGNNRLMQTSKINDATVWSGDASNTYQEFVEGEELIAGGELSEGRAVVFQRNAIRVLTRTRDRSIFTSNLLVTSIGAQGAAGVAITGGWAYFVDTDGFHRTNGAWVGDRGVDDIGRHKVDRTFIASLAANALTSVQGAYDPSNNRVLYRYRKASTISATVFEDILAYDIPTGEWVPIAIQTAALITVASPGYSLDELDQFGTMETLPYSLDSRVWKGGEPKLAAFDGDLKLGYVDGDNLACTLETGALFDGVFRRYVGVTALTDNDAATVRLGVKRKIADDFSWGAAVSIDDDGFAPVDEAGLLHAYRYSSAAGDDWTFMRGFDHEMVGGGSPR